MKKVTNIYICDECDRQVGEGELHRTFRHLWNGVALEVNWEYTTKPDRCKWCAGKSVRSIIESMT